MDDFNINIGSQTIWVRHRDHQVMFDESLDAEDGDFYSGVFRYAEREIWINDILEGNEYLSALLHETVEAINTIYGLKLPHSSIYTISEGIAQAGGGLIYEREEPRDEDPKEDEPEGSSGPDIECRDDDVECGLECAFGHL